jgi:hypothetical protein
MQPALNATPSDECMSMHHPVPHADRGEGRSKGGVVMLVSQSPDDFSDEDDELLDNMGWVAAFATNAKPGAAARVLGKGANFTNLQTGQCFVRFDKTIRVKTH